MGKCPTLAVGVLACMSFAGCLTAADSSTAKAIFTKRCTACHTYGRGIKVGPDLKGVTERRGRSWLVSFIRSSSRLIQTGDPIATSLFRKFRQDRMPDWSEFSVEQVEGVLDYLGADGPEQKEPNERNAVTASPSEIATGRQLFHAKLRLSNGKQACNACHSIRDASLVSIASLGPDLSKAYLKYYDKAVTDFLKQPCFPRRPDPSQERYLTPQESFDLKAYLAFAAGLAIPSMAFQNTAQPGPATQSAAQQRPR